MIKLWGNLDEVTPWLFLKVWDALICCFQKLCTRLR